MDVPVDRIPFSRSLRWWWTWYQLEHQNSFSCVVWFACNILSVSSVMAVGVDHEHRRCILRFRRRYHRNSVMRATYLRDFDAAKVSFSVYSWLLEWAMMTTNVTNRTNENSMTSAENQSDSRSSSPCGLNRVTDQHIQGIAWRRSEHMAC